MANKKTKDPVAYTADRPVYVSGIFTKPGDVFVTDADPEDFWTPREAKEVAAIKAATQEVPGDVDLETLDVSALMALAATKHVQTAGIEKDKKALITAIKAAQEPSL